jgi:hypothetical protein
VVELAGVKMETKKSAIALFLVEVYSLKITHKLFSFIPPFSKMRTNHAYKNICIIGCFRTSTVKDLI